MNGLDDNDFNQHGAWADGGRVPVAEEADETAIPEQMAEGLLEDFCAEFPHIQRAEAAEILHWMAEKSVARTARPSAPALPLKISLLDLCGALLALPHGETFYGIRKLLWVLDDRRVDDLLGHQSPADWFRATGKSKFMCYKSADALRRELKLPVRADQRPESACEAMSESRTSKLKPRKN